MATGLPRCPNPVNATVPDKGGPRNYSALSGGSGQTGCCRPQNVVRNGRIDTGVDPIERELPPWTQTAFHKGLSCLHHGISHVFETFIGLATVVKIELPVVE